MLIVEGKNKHSLLFVFVNGEPEHDWTDETDGSQSAVPLHAAITGKSFHVFIPYNISVYRFSICNKVVDNGTFSTIYCLLFR